MHSHTKDYHETQAPSPNLPNPFMQPSIATIISNKTRYIFSFSTAVTNTFYYMWWKLSAKSLTGSASVFYQTCISISDQSGTVHCKAPFNRWIEDKWTSQLNAQKQCSHSSNHRANVLKWNRAMNSRYLPLHTAATWGQLSYNHFDVIGVRGHAQKQRIKQFCMLYTVYCQPKGIVLWIWKNKI